jgi:hypothetical protein
MSKLKRHDSLQSCRSGATPALPCRIPARQRPPLAQTSNPVAKATPDCQP